MKLTKTQCDRLQAKEKPYKKFDGGGLYLEVMPNGNKHWRFKYRYNNKEKRMAFGRYPVVTLVQARQKRENAKNLLNENIDPSQDRKEQKRLAQIRANNTFNAVGMEWYNLQLERWGEARKKYVLEKLDKNVFPFLGNQIISEIKPLDLLDVLKMIEKRGAFYTAKSVNNICSQIFKYAVITGRCENNPAINLTIALKSKPVEHFPAIESAEIPKLLKAVSTNEVGLYPQTQDAIIFSMLTFVRPKEVRHARWQDIDFENTTWHIPAKFMKMKKDHIVPLATQSMTLLQRQKERTKHINTEWVFPGLHRPKNPMSDGTVNKALRLLGYKGRMTAHGFRALARTTIREELDYPPDVIEAQLAHKPSGPLGAAYDRSKFLKQRKIMMQDWADFILGLTQKYD